MNYKEFRSILDEMENDKIHHKSIIDPNKYHCNYEIHTNAIMKINKELSYLTDVLNNQIMNVDKDKILSLNAEIFYEKAKSKGLIERIEEFEKSNQKG